MSVSHRVCVFEVFLIKACEVDFLLNLSKFAWFTSMFSSGNTRLLSHLLLAQCRSVDQRNSVKPSAGRCVLSPPCDLCVHICTRAHVSGV